MSVEYCHACGSRVDTDVVTVLGKYLMYLDCALTGCEWKAAAHTQRSQGVQRFLGGEEYYLSDGGYSRIVFGCSLQVFLTSNSLDSAREAWVRNKELIADVQREARRIYERG
ncbi:MAG: hypothetical protein ACYS7Y_29910 [Planctomycetota bacterium]|jgi:bifunctional pyridoxal-dependent enzyme with beta-cystathionase and maltose regulon repressor activities